MELTLVMVVIRLIDICTVPMSGTPALFIIESSDKLDTKTMLRETIWYHYNYSSETASWNRNAAEVQNIPECGAIKAWSDNKKFISVLESNVKDALYIVTTHKTIKNQFEQSAPIAINLTDASLGMINMPLHGEWSTPFLPTKMCLFNSHAVFTGYGKAIVIANAVDASARIFTANPEVLETAKIERCIEPCIVNSIGKMMILSRRCPKDWLVFYNRPETRMAPELLPLIANTVTPDFKITDTIQLSKGWYTGGSFAFDACATDDNSIILATVTGLLKKPVIQILRSLDAGTTWKELTNIPIDEVPLRIRITSSDKRILIACTFKRHDGYHVMAAEFDR